LLGWGSGVMLGRASMVLLGTGGGVRVAGSAEGVIAAGCDA
jgi:hypothetical protein